MDVHTGMDNGKLYTVHGILDKILHTSSPPPETKPESVGVGIEQGPFLTKWSRKLFLLRKGQYEYQKMQIFTLIPNLQTKLRISAPIKSYYKNCILLFF